MAQQARLVTTTVPIVATSVVDLVALGLVASLARAGGNITGPASDPGPEFDGKILELLKEAVPKVKRVAVLEWKVATDGVWGAHRQAAAKSLGLTLFHTDSGPNEFSEAFASISRYRPDALVVGRGTYFLANRQRIVDYAMRNNLPVVTTPRAFAEIGGLLSYGADNEAHYRIAADYVDQILRGAKPADLPVQLPMKFELVVNLKAARVLGLTMPRSLLARADRVSE